MNKYLKVQLAKKVYDSLVNYSTFNPNMINNACYLIGFFPKNANEKLYMRNNLLNYFMNDLAHIVDHLVPVEATEFEKKQLAYIESRWAFEDLETYIKGMDKEIDEDAEFNPEDPKSLGLVFTAADVPIVERVKGVLPAEPPVERNPLRDLIKVELKPFNGNDKPRRGRPINKK
jgi:hypothetical protein